MKPKKKVRLDGYYWIKIKSYSRPKIAEYVRFLDEFWITGSVDFFKKSDFYYISTRPLKPGKK